MMRLEESTPVLPYEIKLAPNGYPEEIEDWTDEQLADSYAHHLDLTPYSNDTLDWLMELESEMIRRDAANEQAAVAPELPIQPEFPYADKAGDREALQLQLPVFNLPEYAVAGQYHRIGDGNEPQLVPGVQLEVRNTIFGAVPIYRDPISGEVYRVAHS